MTLELEPTSPPASAPNTEVEEPVLEPADDENVSDEPSEANVVVMDGRKSRQLFATLASGAIKAGIGFLQTQLGEATPLPPRKRRQQAPAIDGDKVGYSGAAQLLAIPIGTLRSMVCRHQVPHIRLSPRIVIFDVQALRAWLAARAIPALNDNDTWL